jgi:beta-lactamase class A
MRFFCFIDEVDRPVKDLTVARRALCLRTLFRFAFAAFTLSQAVPAAADVKDVAFIPPAPSATQPVTSPDLAETLDVSNQLALERCLKDLELLPAVASKHLAVSLVDITDTARPVLAQVNGDEEFYAASLPKIAILLGAFAKAADGRLTIDDAMVDELKLMIRRSSNTAASNMLARVGIEYLASVLSSDRYRLYDPKRNGGLWVGRAYASNGMGRKPDPLHGLSHAATAFQVSRFYYLLETGQLVSKEASAQMKAILADTAIHHKFVAGLQAVHPDATLYRKSGTWRNFHADSAIIEREGRRYIAVALSDDPRGGEWFKSLIVGLDDIVFAKGQKTL